MPQALPRELYESFNTSSAFYGQSFAHTHVRQVVEILKEEMKEG
jgi:hypothetical protein